MNEEGEMKRKTKKWFSYSLLSLFRKKAGNMEYSMKFELGKDFWLTYYPLNPAR